MVSKILLLSIMIPIVFLGGCVSAPNKQDNNAMQCDPKENDYLVCKDDQNRSIQGHRGFFEGGSHLR